MNPEPLHTIQREATALGRSLVRNRKHCVYSVSDTAGHSRLLVVPRSGSDFRARHNARAFLRRLARQLGGTA